MSSDYAEKKPHIYAYRRRKRANSYFEKLEKIVDVSSIKDVKQLESKLEDLQFRIYAKLGVFDSLKGEETRKDPLQRALKKGSRIADPVAYYICPKCRRKGYLFSPNLDEDKVDLYALHILWNEQQMQVCHIGKCRRNLILVRSPPSEGILTLI
jgi:hypothetical protein